MASLEYAILGHATFGHPNDFRQSVIFANVKDTAKNYNFLKIFDLSNAIKVFPGESLYCMRKEMNENVSYISFTIYSFANEKNSKRNGTFIGTSIVFKKYLPKIDVIINALHYYHQELKSKNVVNGKLIIEHSNQFIKPEKVEYNLESTQANYIIQNLFVEKINNSLLFYIPKDNKELMNNLELSLNLLDKFNELYFSSNLSTVQYTQSKGLYLLKEITSLRDMANKIQVEINQKNEQLLQKIASKNNEVAGKLKADLQKTHGIIRENELKLSEYQKRNKSNSEIIHKYKDIINHFENESKNIISSFRKHEIDENTLKSNINNLHAKLNRDCTNLPTPYNIVQEHAVRGETQYLHLKKQNTEVRSVETDNKGFGINIFEILTFVLAILLIGSWLFFIFSEPEESDTEINGPTIETQIGTLSSDDLKLVNDKLQPNVEIDTVVQIIFNNNPHDVKEYFSKHKDNFTTLLREKNESSFDKSTNGKYVYNGRALKNIPMKKE